MENASKALIMAASILLGVMIISLGVYIFSVFGNYSADTYKQMEETEINKFNAQFLKYYGTVTTEDGHTETIKCTIHDIISLANMAQQNNIKYELENEPEYNTNTYYIQIDIVGMDNNIKIVFILRLILLEIKI